MAERPQLDFDEQVAKFTPRQIEACSALDSGTIKYLLYGGAMGGGKSYFLRWVAPRILIDLASKGIRKAVVMLACEDYPALKDRQLTKIANEYPPWMGISYSDHREYGRCFVMDDDYGGGIICFRNLDDPSKYMSAEFAAILVDELTKNQFGLFDSLRTRARWPGLKDIECPFIAGTNPGGIGHGWVKQFWMSKQFPPEWISPIDHRSEWCYIPSLADDNPHLDQSYWQMLETLPLPLRKAYRYGYWDTFIGQAFPELSKITHEYDPGGSLFPDGHFVFQTFDWGFGKPFSAGWWHTDADGRLFRAAEWYGWSGKANEGCRMEDSAIADGIIQREKEWGIWGKSIIRIAGSDCFNKKPDYKGGGQGPSTAEVFRNKGIILRPGDPNRKLKIRQLRERLKIPEIGMPMMLIAKNCEHFWRTVCDLVVDENNIEDVDTDAEDHVYDEACHVCMARPLSSIPEVKIIRRPPKDGSEVAWLEQKEIKKQIINPGGNYEW